MSYRRMGIVLAASFGMVAADAGCALGQAGGTIRPRVVVVVTYFEVGADTGDRPGELQMWVERDRLTRQIEVPGMTRAVRVNADGTEMAVCIGPGNIKPGVNLMALGSDPRFDLRGSFWLINGIAGIAPEDGTIGSAVWTDYVVNGDLAKEIDPRETPTAWPDGFLSLDAVTQEDPKGGAGWEEDVRSWRGESARANRRGNVIRMNLGLVRWAYERTNDMALPEDAAMKAMRIRFKGAVGTGSGPKVQVGANLATEIFWHGGRMDAWAHRWVSFETDGVARLGTTAMNDTGTMLALEALTKQGRADWNKAVLLRTASNFDVAPPRVSAAEDLASERHGAYTAYLRALEAAYMVGHRVVAAWMGSGGR